MKKKFELILTDEKFNPEEHEFFYYDITYFKYEKFTEKDSFSFFTKGMYNEEKDNNALGINFNRIKEKELTQEENEAAWHMRKENDQAIWDTAKEKEKKDKAEREELIKDYGEDAINFIKKIDDTQRNNVSS